MSAGRNFSQVQNSATLYAMERAFPCTPVEPHWLVQPLERPLPEAPRATQLTQLKLEHIKSQFFMRLNF